MCTYPEGVAKHSPGLPRSSYPGEVRGHLKRCIQRFSLRHAQGSRVAATLGVTVLYKLFGVNAYVTWSRNIVELASATPRVAATQQPWAVLYNPFGVNAYVTWSSNIVELVGVLLTQTIQKLSGSRQEMLTRCFISQPGSPISQNGYPLAQSSQHDQAA